VSGSKGACVAFGTIRWRAGPGGGVRRHRTCRACGWTAFSGPTVASLRARIVDKMLPCDWPTSAWISWLLPVAVVGLDLFLIVIRNVWRDLLFALRVACIGRLRLKAEKRAPGGRLLPHMSADWDRIAATLRRRLVFSLVSILLLPRLK